MHAASFPYFSVLGAALARRRHGYRLAIDWHEVWGRSYWRTYAGAITGTVGWLVQRRCIRLAHRAYCMSHVQARRLLAEGYRGVPVVLPGIYAGPVQYSSADEVDPALVVYAGRHVREKRVDALVRGFAEAREQPARPAARAVRRRARFAASPRADRRARPRRAHSAHGRRPEDEVAAALARAACLATASEREGYGLVVVEAAARGTPSVVVEGPENAATELVTDGVNGAIAPTAEPADRRRRNLEGDRRRREASRTPRPSGSIGMQRTCASNARWSSSRATTRQRAPTTPSRVRRVQKGGVT